MAARNLNDDQQKAFEIIKKFLDHPTVDTFVLLGNAGTGKTFLMQYLASWLSRNQQPYSLLASTGRAATVLKGKTGHSARTVHSELYHFNKVDGDDEDIPEDAPIDRYGQMTLRFALRVPDEAKKVYIIDESSMLSSEPSDSQSVAFGSGVLLIDFFNAIGHNKVIFVGDPCQLPPVGQSISPALDENWLNSSGRIAITARLEKIERHDPDNDILVLANAIRNMTFQNSWPTWPKLPAKHLNSIKLYSSDIELFQAYVESYKKSGYNGTVAIARSNKMVKYINSEMRKDLFGELDRPLQLNDVLLVTTNNQKAPLTNGDFVTVLKIGEIRSKLNLVFQSVRVKNLATDEEFEILLSLDVLYGPNPNLAPEQQRSLMIDFSRRMKKKGIKANTQLYKEALRDDDFVNSLRAVYGYGVTCHKSQGGEWNDVFLFLDKSMYGMPRPELFQWWYTAVTRAKKQLHLLNDWWIR